MIKTYQEYIKEFLSNLESSGRKKGTLIAYKSDLEQFLQFLKDNEDIDLNSYQNFLKAIKLAPISINRKLNNIKNFCTFLNKTKNLNIDIDSFTKLKQKQSKQKSLNQNQIAKLRDLSKKNTKAFTIIELALQTGMKISEISELRTHDIDFTNRRITNRKDNKHVEIPLNDKIYYILKDYINEHHNHECEYVFYTSNHNNINVRNIRRMVGGFFKKAGIRSMSFNDLRNTFILKQLESGVSIQTLSKVLGNKSISSVKMYTKVLRKKIKGDKDSIVEV